MNGSDVQRPMFWLKPEFWGGVRLGLSIVIVVLAFAGLATDSHLVLQLWRIALLLLMIVSAPPAIRRFYGSHRLDRAPNGVRVFLTLVLIALFIFLIVHLTMRILRF